MNGQFGSSNLPFPGIVISCRGSQACIRLATSTMTPHLRATVGKFVLLKHTLGGAVGMITEIKCDEARYDDSRAVDAVAEVMLIGEISGIAGQDVKFERGVRNYPAIGDEVDLLSCEELDLIQKPRSSQTIHIGAAGGDGTALVHIDPDALFTNHFAILGSTGVGKSSGMAIILNALMASRPNVRALLLDVHNEYGKCFGQNSTAIDVETLKLPFWLFNFDELTDALYGGRPPVLEELDILAEVIPVAKATYSALKAGPERQLLTRRQNRQTGFTVDTPCPFIIQDLIRLIDERMGKLENRATRMTHHRLMARIETVRNDPRYAFMFENANVGGDTMAQVLEQLFSVGSGRVGITVLKLADLPDEVVDAVICVVLRMAFEFGLWSGVSSPLLIICEEAHRFASADISSGFAPTRRALSRIAKEGRKYGVHLGLVTQRPAELDPTIVSQCNTLFMMRMANDRDQQLLRSAIPDSAANLLSFLPSLRTGEVIAAGEAIALPMRFEFNRLPNRDIPANDQMVQDRIGSHPRDLNAGLQTAIERWRKATSLSTPSTSPILEDASGDEDGERARQASLARDLHSLIRAETGAKRS